MCIYHVINFQTEDQYIFIHDALLEAALCGNSEVPARSLHQHLEALLQTDVGESTTGMEAEFKVVGLLNKPIKAHNNN